MTLNSELDQFYENYMDVILSHDLQISRFRFRHLMRSEHDKLPEKIKKFDLAKRAKQDWDNEAYIIESICKQKNRDHTNLLNMLYFLLDEVRNPGIVELLFNNNTHEGSDLYSQLLSCVYINFCERFVDPFEEDTTVFFTEPAIINLLQSQTIGGIRMEHRSVSGMHMISFDKPVNLQRLAQPQQYTYIRIPFYTEILKEISASLLPIPIIDWGIEGRIRNKILNIRHSYKLLPEDKTMTIDTLFNVRQNWQYGGKVQKLSCQAATFEYLPITDFDSLLEKEGINKENYPEYEKEKTQFNQFQEVIGCLYNIYYYEKYIRNLEQRKSRIENASLTLSQDSQSYKVNKEYIQEIAAQIELLQNLQKQHVKQLRCCQYIINHSSAEDSNFNKKLAREVVDWIYYDKKDSPSQNMLYEFILGCFYTTVTPSSFFSSREDLINNRHNSPDLQREYDKQFGLVLTH